jgi:hypothetical protein
MLQISDVKIVYVFWPLTAVLKTGAWSYLSLIQLSCMEHFKKKFDFDVRVIKVVHF